jgi:hypothetical protein
MNETKTSVDDDQMRLEIACAILQEPSKMTPVPAMKYAESESL